MKTNRKYGLLAGILAIAVLLFGGLWLSESPAGYMSIDVNPSIELTYNRFNKIIAVEGVNQDGKNLIAGKDLIGDDVDDGVEKIVEALLTAGYLTQEDSKILFSVDDSATSLNLLTRIKYEVVYWLKEYYEKIDVISQSYQLSSKERSQAEKLKLSSGKYAILLELIGSANIDDSIDSNLINITLGELLESLNNDDFESNRIHLKWDHDDNDDVMGDDIDDEMDNTMNGDADKDIEDKMDDEMDDKHDHDEENDRDEDDHDENDLDEGDRIEGDRDIDDHDENDLDEGDRIEGDRDIDDHDENNRDENDHYDDDRDRDCRDDRHKKHHHRNSWDEDFNDD